MAEKGKRVATKEETKNNKKKKKNKGLKITGLVCLLFVVIILGVVAGIALNKLSMMDYYDIDETNLAISKETGHRNIVIFGVDSRSDSYVNTRSDSIIIVNIDEKTKEVKLTSVYRDTYLDRNGTLDKINHAYAEGGPELAIQTLNRNLDLDITEFVTVNFYAVIEVVDAVGGISIDVDSSELKYINNYVNEIKRVTGESSANVTKTGKQTLNGVQALAYSRIRYTDGGDYKRTERMREVLMAVAEKAKTLNLSQLNTIANAVLPEIQTNISSTEIIALLPQATQFTFSESNIGWPYEVRGQTINGVWYGVPVDLEANVTKLHKEVFGDEDYVPSETVKSISDKIKTKTGVK